MKKVTARTATRRPRTAAGGAAAAEGDAELVTAASSGDPQAMERLLARVQAAAWRFSVAVCGGADDAEDAVQEALLKTYRYSGRLREPKAFRPWLHRVVKNACLMGRRKRVHEPARLESLDQAADGALEVADPGRNPEQIAANTRLRSRLRDALRTLPTAQRTIVFLRDIEGLSTREVAMLMDISEDNAKVRLGRARKALQRALAAPAR